MPIFWQNLVCRSNGGPIAHTGGALHDAVSINYDEEVAILAEAAKIIQRDIFRQENPEFNGYFKENCCEDFYPTQ